ncbi:hypothetical protein [Mycobacterium sp. ENV421]|uniref:hypothetical protein n=1 Tax=Mycobacterium sp. ENV421 TaxID=1213407 RepID=UPI001E2B6CF0|nr:hypothetical protein [Mycobacterium sp. ENV421]
MAAQHVMPGRGRRIAVRVVCAVSAVAAVLLAVLAANDLYFAGFPDSHLTDYDRAAGTPKRVLMWAQWGFVPIFLLLALAPMKSKVRATALVVGLVVLVGTAVAQRVGIPWYFATHLGLDNGAGG